MSESSSATVDSFAQNDQDALPVYEMGTFVCGRQHVEQWATTDFNPGKQPEQLRVNRSTKFK